MDSLLKTNRKTTFRNLVILFLAAALIVMPIFVWGVPNGSDSTQHYQFALTIYDSLQNGNFYPSLASTTNHGFGDVGIRFYPPFAYYVMAGFRCLTGNWYDASVLSFLLWFFLGGVGVYLWCREWFSENAALAAGVVYIYLPYFAHQIYDSFMYASFAGSALLPFCLLFVTRLFRTNDVKDAFGLTFFYALLIITHLPLTVIGSLSLLVYSLVLFNRENFFSRLLKLSSAVCLAVLATAFYWSRMATELDFVKHTTEYFTVDVYDYRGNFLASFLNSFLYGADYGSYSYGNLLFLLIAVVCLPFIAIFYIWSKDETDRSFTGVAVLLAFSIFISTPLSLFVWERFSLLQKVQFPWRWMTVISITGAVFVAAAFNSLKDLYRTKHRPIVLVTVGLLMIGVIFTSTRLLSSPMQMPRQDFIEQTKYLLNARSYECWWSRPARKEAVQNPQEVSIANRSAQIIDWQPTRKEIAVSAGNPADVRFAVFYYPHWHATVNGQPAETKFDEYGALMVAVPSESADVKIQFEEPSFVILAYRVSLFTWLFLAIIGIFIFRKSAAAVFQNAHSDSNSLKSFS